MLVSGVDLAIPPRLKLHSLTGRAIVRGNVPTCLGLDVTLTELASKRTYQRYRSLPSPSFEFTEVVGTTVELRACANDLDCTKPVLVRLDRDASAHRSVRVRLAVAFPRRPPRERGRRRQGCR